MTVSTFNIAAGADDAYALSAANTVYANVAFGSAEATDTNSLGQRVLAGADFNIYVGLMRWDTSSIPDGDTVDSATVTLIATATILNADTRNFTMDWYDFGATPGAEDWVHDALSNAGSFALSGMTGGVGGSNVLTLSAVSNISKTGFTGLRSHVDGGAPTGNNRFFWATLENATHAEPQLVVTHTTPPPPPPPPATGKMFLLW